MIRTWLVLGATSTLARCFIRAEAAPGARLILAARDLEDAAHTAADAAARGADARTHPYDARDPRTIQPLLDTLGKTDGPVGIAVFVGSMPEQAAIDASPELLSGTITDSLTGPAELLTRAIPLLEARPGSAVIGVSSVAGDRGRLGNYVYGAAKAGFTCYLSGLRNRLGRADVHVLTVKPGPVDTAMTWSLGRMPLPTTPEAAVADIRKALRKKKNVLYTKGPWRLVMTILRAIPEPIFKKLKI